MLLSVLPLKLAWIPASAGMTLSGGCPLNVMAAQAAIHGMSLHLDVKTASMRKLVVDTGLRKRGFFAAMTFK